MSLRLLLPGRLPLNRIVATGVRVWCRPMSNRLVKQCAHRPALRAVIQSIGGLSLKLSSWAAERTAEPTHPGISETSSSSTTEATTRNPDLPLRKARKITLPLDPSGEELTRAGVNVLAEAFVWCLMIAVVYYEWQSSISESKARREEAEAKFRRLENSFDEIVTYLREERGLREALEGKIASLNTSPAITVVSKPRRFTKGWVTSSAGESEFTVFVGLLFVLLDVAMRCLTAAFSRRQEP